VQVKKKKIKKKKKKKKKKKTLTQNNGTSTVYVYVVQLSWQLWIIASETNHSTHSYLLLFFCYQCERLFLQMPTTYIAICERKNLPIFPL